MNPLRRMCATVSAAAGTAAAAALLVTIMPPTNVLAQQAPTPGAAAVEEAAAVQEDEAGGGLSIDASLFVPTSYVFRGYVIEEDHCLWQPELILSYGTSIGDIDVTPYIGAWANLTDAPAPGDPEWFNEIDVYVGADISLPADFTLGVIYTWYNSPADAFDDIHEVGLTLSHDSCLQPAVGIYYELENNDTGDENTYIELSITPGFDVEQLPALRFDFPVVLGLTPDEYYTDSDGDSETFGYLSGGVTATYALNDNWSIEGGVDWVQMLADSAEDSNEGDDYQVVGRVGVRFTN
jgi:hypothetical protein